jgi:CRP/FNR family transcriptional regulator, cyclic AMP receptor protein
VRRSGHTDRIDLLRQVSLFHELNDSEIARLALSAEQVSFEPGTVLMRQGTTGRELLVILEGSLRVERDGRAVAHLGHGDVVGEMSLLDGQPRSATVVAESRLACLRINGDSFDKALESMPSLARKILYVLSRRIRDLHERFVVPRTEHGPSEARRSDGPGPMIEGVFCTREHFNSPSAAYCSTCGISMLQASRELALAPRPPLGVLTTDDGSLHVLDADFVIGATPAEDERVQSNEARSLALTGQGIARRHCHVLLRDWTAVVKAVAPITLSIPGSEGEIVLSGDQEHEFIEGSVLAVGSRSVRYHSNVLEI